MHALHNQNKLGFDPYIWLYFVGIGSNNAIRTWTITGQVSILYDCIILECFYVSSTIYSTVKDALSFKPINVTSLTHSMFFTKAWFTYAAHISHIEQPANKHVKQEITTAVQSFSLKTSHISGVVFNLKAALRWLLGPVYPGPRCPDVCCRWTRWHPPVPAVFEPAGDLTPKQRAALVVASP